MTSSVDLTKLSIEELNVLAAQARAKADQLVVIQELEDLEAVEGRKERIGAAVDTLTNLLGPVDAPPYDPSGELPATIRGLKAHTAEVLGANAGLALDLIFEGLDQIASTVRDLAEVMRNG